MHQVPGDGGYIVTYGLPQCNVTQIVTARAAIYTLGCVVDVRSSDELNQYEMRVVLNRAPSPSIRRELDRATIDALQMSCAPAPSNSPPPRRRASFRLIRRYMPAR